MVEWWAIAVLPDDDMGALRAQAADSGIPRGYAAGLSGPPGGTPIGTPPPPPLSLRVFGFKV